MGSRAAHRVGLGVALATVLGLAAAASAARVTGGGSARTDCFAEFEVAGAIAAPTAAECADGDPACDADGACDDRCRFRVALCANQHDLAPTCVPPGSLRSIAPTGRARRLGLAVPAPDDSACGAFLDVDVPVKVARRTHAKRPGTVKLGAVAVASTRPAKDRDTLVLTCRPREGACPAPAVPTTTTTTLPPAACGASGCCPAEQIVLSSQAGTLKVDGLPTFGFPTGVRTVMNSGPADGTCRHDVVVPVDGFVVPNFDLPALNYCSSITPLGCEAGVGLGAGALWDGQSPAGCALTDVAKTADTSDGICNPPGEPCTTAAGGAGANTLGDTDVVRSPSASAGVRNVLDLRVRSVTWSDSECSPALTPGCCTAAAFGDSPDDLPITSFDFILSPTTDHASASFADKNGDGCKRAGSGFGPGAVADGPVGLDGSPAAGPCCVVGQATTVVSVGVGLSGGAPLFDLGFQSVIPNTVTACNPYPADPGSCVVTTDACLQ